MDTDFGALALAPALLSVVEELGFTALTPIQAQAIPALLGGADVVGESRTGSGKTAAFGLPLLHRLELQRRVPGALVLCPTRELSAQVGRELRKFGRGLPGLAVVVLTGGPWPIEALIEGRFPLSSRGQQGFQVQSHVDLPRCLSTPREPGACRCSHPAAGRRRSKSFPRSGVDAGRQNMRGVGRAGLVCLALPFHRR
jgi:hypothetical protein